MLSYLKPLPNSAFVAAIKLKTPTLHPSKVADATLLLQVAKCGSELLVANLQCFPNGDLRERPRLTAEERATLLGGDWSASDVERALWAHVGGIGPPMTPQRSCTDF